MINRQLALAIVCVLLIAGAALYGGIFFGGSAAPQKDRDIIFQASTIDALLQGAMDGTVSFAEMKKHGDFGTGCFEGIDGEFIALDGEFYQTRSDGSVIPVTDEMTTPFAAVTFFDHDDTLVFDEPMNLSVFEKRLEERLPSQNLFYAIRIDGTFPYIKARNVPKQEKPYPPLADAVEEQAVFEFRNTTGSLIGFWTPELAKGVNIPGYHLHYITDDRTGGGHILELEFDRAEVKIDQTAGFSMLLPTEGEFLAVDLGGDLQSDLEKVEK